MQNLSVRKTDRIGFSHPFDVVAIGVMVGAAAILDLANPFDVVATSNRDCCKRADVILIL
jgi:hypothetical protein